MPDWSKPLVSCLLISLFLVLACTIAPAGPDTPASGGNPSETTALPEEKAERETERPESEAPGRESTDCLDNGDLDSISREFTANPFRARETYVNERICLTGRIESHFRENHAIGVSVRVTDDWNINLGKRRESTLKTPRLDYHLEMEEWEGWMMASSVGDSVKFECTIESIPDSGDGYGYPPGTPKLQGCVPLSASDIAFMPTSLPVPTDTPSPTWTPEPTITLPPPIFLGRIGCEDCPILKLERGFDLSTISEGESYRATACTEWAEGSRDSELKWAHKEQHRSVEDEGIILLDGSSARELPTYAKFGGCVAMHVAFQGTVYYYQDRTYGSRVSRQRGRGNNTYAIPTFHVVAFTQISEAQHERGFFPENTSGSQEGDR